MSEPAKMWEVGPPDWEWSMIVHAATRGQAKHKLVGFDGWLEFVDVRAKRQSMLDGKAITRDNLIEAGFPEYWEGERIKAYEYVGACNCTICQAVWQT